MTESSSMRARLLRVCAVAVLALTLVVTLASSAFACLAAGGGGGSASLPYTDSINMPDTWEAHRIGQLVVN